MHSGGAGAPPWTTTTPCQELADRRQHHPEKLQDFSDKMMRRAVRFADWAGCVREAAQREFRASDPQTQALIADLTEKVIG